jgi:[ribosomal protein S5]-alanine N-acetyltransferase
MPPAPTARLEFRRWTPGDVPLATLLWSDPRVMHFLGGPYSSEEVHARIERELANDDAHGVQYWPVFTIEGGEFAGCCGLKPHEPEHRRYEIGFHFRPEFWRTGFAYEASLAVIDYAFDTLGAAELYAGRHPDNIASANLLAKLGFTQIGTHHFARTGLEHPWYVRARGR